MAVYTAGVVGFRDKIEAIKDLLDEAVMEHDSEASDDVLTYVMNAIDNLGFAMEQYDDELEGEVDG